MTTRDEITAIATSGPLALQGAACFMACVAYPESFEKRTRFVNAAQASYLKNAYAADRGKASACVDSGIRSWTAQQARNCLESGFRRLDHRYDAAMLAWERVLNWAAEDVAKLSIAALAQAAGQDVNMKAEYSGSSVNSVRAFSLDQYGPERQNSAKHANNWHARVWLQSLSVLHLSVALAHAMVPVRGKGGTEFNLLYRPETWLESAVATAEYMVLVLKAADILPVGLPIVRIHDGGTDFAKP